MRNNDVVRVLVFALLDQALEKAEVIVVNIKINGRLIPDGFYEGVVNNFFVGT